MNLDLLSIEDLKASTAAAQALALHENNTQKTSFTTKLRSVLSLASIEEIVSWLPEGKIWRIHKIESFKTAVLPLFYEVSGWEAFLLVVCAHGFKEVSRGVDSVAFYNENFSRDEPSFSLMSTRGGGAVEEASALLASVQGLLKSSAGGMLQGGGATSQASFLYNMEPKQISINQLVSPFDSSRINGGMNLVDLLRLETLAKGARADAQQENERKRKAAEEETSSTSSSTTTPFKKKKPKKKWLPPLGPPEAESAAILGKRLAGSWGHTSAEAFSTLSGLRR